MTSPLEANSPLWVEMFGMQWMGTSNYEWWGGKVPEIFAHLQDGNYERAYTLARVSLAGPIAGAFGHTFVWAAVIALIALVPAVVLALATPDARKAASPGAASPR